MPFSAANAEKVLRKIQSQYRGPGGAIAIVKDGKTVATNTCGYADMDRRIAVTPRTQFPICSISKQMVCLTMIDLSRNPTPAMKEKGGGTFWQRCDDEMAKLLPHLTKRKDMSVTLPDLYNMQSGIRDYWAMTTVWGARPDDTFSLFEDAPKALERTRSFHFEPGTEYSYCKNNFHVLARILESVSGQSLGQLLSERVFKPAGMSTASLCPNTNGHPLPIVGYEGDVQRGYFPALNRMEWSGDAGIVASLEDMIAYEAWLDRSWADFDSLYRVIAEPQTYKDGTPAAYGFGLSASEVAGEACLGHGGALRGFRLQRMHMPAERLSVVVLFNHEADSGSAAGQVLQQMLGWQAPENAGCDAASEWTGDFLDEQTLLSISIEEAKRGELSLRYGTLPEKLTLEDPKRARSASMMAEIKGDILHIERSKDNRILHARRIINNPEAETAPSFAQRYTGKYYCADADSTFHCSGEGGLMYGYFDGYLGRGTALLMRHLGQHVWLLACPRGLDAPAPGDWTMVFHQGDGESTSEVTIGCWLARGLKFVKCQESVEMASR